MKLKKGIIFLLTTISFLICGPAHAQAILKHDSHTCLSPSSITMNLMCLADSSDPSHPDRIETQLLVPREGDVQGGFRSYYRQLMATLPSSGRRLDLHVSIDEENCDGVSEVGLSLYISRSDSTENDFGSNNIGLSLDYGDPFSLTTSANDETITCSVTFFR